MNIQGAVILVAGGAGNIGHYLALRLKERGATVVIGDRDIELLKDNDHDISVFQIEGTDPTAVEQMIADITGQHERIDALINCTGTIYSEPLINLTNPARMRHNYDTFTRMVESNLYTTFLIGSCVAESMVRQRTRGLILNFSSISARGNAGQTAYAAAKAGVEAMTNVWAKELGPMGIRCVALAPGFIDTPSTHHALHQKTLKHVTSNTPLRRLGKLEEIASAVEYVLENDFVTGTVLEIDGGLTF